MVTKVVTKSGDELWLISKLPVLGRHEIARIEFAKWELRKEQTNRKN